MKATVQWTDDMRFAASADSGHEVIIDTGTANGGGDTGPRPMEMVLMGLGGCTGMDVVSILKKMRIEFDDFRIDIEADRAADHPKVFNRVNMVYRVWGRDVPEDKVKRAVELTQERYCSVLHMVNKTAQVGYRYEVNGPR